MSARRFLLVCHDAGGTVPPLLAIAEALIRSGHDVLFLSQPSVRLRAERAGCRFFDFSRIAAYERRKPLEDQFALAWPMITGSTIGDDVHALASRHQADVIVVDANLGGALAAAEALNQPSVVLLHSMYKTFVDNWFADYWPLFESAINETRAGYGLAPADSWPSVFACHDRLLAVVPTVFDAPVADVPAGMRHFGFLVPTDSTVSDMAVDFPHGDDPTVLVGLSTTYQAHEDLLQRILDALGGMSVRALVSTAEQIDIDTLRVPTNVTVTDFVGHTQVMSRTDIMVTHAGLGTVAAALSVGVPLVCTPISRDQPLNAHRVADLGAGVALSHNTDSGHIAAAIEQTLSDPAYRDAAATLARLSLHEGGASAAAAELEALTDQTSPSD
jgi:UDP:flavonoid glycosyltransferase YjiC (YdhE family)